MRVKGLSLNHTTSYLWPRGHTHAHAHTFLGESDYKKPGVHLVLKKLFCAQIFSKNFSVFIVVYPTLVLYLYIHLFVSVCIPIVDKTLDNISSVLEIGVQPYQTDSFHVEFQHSEIRHIIWIFIADSVGQYTENTVYRGIKIKSASFFANTKIL